MQNMKSKVHNLGLLKTVTTDRSLPFYQQQLPAYSEYETYENSSQLCTESYLLHEDLCDITIFPTFLPPSSYIVTELSTPSPLERDVFYGRPLRSSALLLRKCTHTITEHQKWILLQYSDNQSFLPFTTTDKVT